MKTFELLMLPHSPKEGMHLRLSPPLSTLWLKFWKYSSWVCRKRDGGGNALWREAGGVSKLKITPELVDVPGCLEEESGVLTVPRWDTQLYTKHVTTPRTVDPATYFEECGQKGRRLTSVPRTSLGERSLCPLSPYGFLKTRGVTLESQ